MLKTVHGKIHGRIIELDDDLGVLEEGKEIDVTVRMILSPIAYQPGQGLLHTEGALADDTEWDAIMEDIYQARKQDRQRHIALMEES
jgi:hypothetical protein